MMTDASGIPGTPGIFSKSPNSKRKKSYLAEEEDIVVKPSPELIPDEYQHNSNEGVLLHIFKNSREDSVSDDFVQTMKNINYTISEENQHYFKDKETLLQDLEKVKGETADKSALILVFIGNFKKDGYLYLGDESESSDEVHVKDIWNEFTANKCIDLKYKPKIFIFATSPWSVSRITTDSKRHRTLCFDKVYDFPAESDLLIIYNKTEDVSAVARQDFLDQLSYNVEKYSKKYDIIDLVSYDQKSVPLVISTLTRKFYLTPSNEREHYLSIMENNDSLEDSLKNIKEAVQKLHETKKKKKESKFLKNFSFRKKNEEKPKIVVKKPETSVVKEAPVKPKGVLPPRNSASSVGTRSRHQSETDNDRRTSVSATTQKKPHWRF